MPHPTKFLAECIAIFNVRVRICDVGNKSLNVVELRSSAKARKLPLGTMTRIVKARKLWCYNGFHELLRIVDRKYECFKKRKVDAVWRKRSTSDVISK